MKRFLVPDVTGLPASRSISESFERHYRDIHDLPKAWFLVKGYDYERFMPDEIRFFQWRMVDSNYDERVAWVLSQHAF